MASHFQTPTRRLEVQPADAGGPYVADFLCREAKLIVELDGILHDGRQNEDRQRDGYLRAQGYQTLRFSNADVLGNLEGVLMTMLAALNSGPPPTPPACGRGEA